MLADNKKLPKVTVITSSYNQALFIEETIESVLNQDYPNIEYLIFDDNSTDGTQDILARYGDKIRWEILSEKTPQTPTINKGWKMTDGEIITWLNSDDTFYPDSVSKAVAYLESHPETGIVFGDSMFTEEDGTEIELSIPAPNFNFRDYVVNCINLITQPSAFIRRDVIKKIGYLDESYDYIMDWDFWLRAGLHFKIDYIPEVLSTYRLHSESKSVSQAAKIAPELEIAYRRLFSNQDLSDEIKKTESEAMMNMYFTTGSYYLTGNDKENASKMADRALRYNPGGVLNPKNIHKYLYCKFADRNLYQKFSKLLKQKRVA